LVFAGVASFSLAGCLTDVEQFNLGLNDYTPSAECSATIVSEFSAVSSFAIGDGHDVIIVPGFGTNNAYMAELRDRLQTRGYTAHSWAGGLNTGANIDDARRFEQQLLDLYQTNGGQKISLVGYSLGGTYAKELARAHPDKVRNVITLSSPSNLNDPVVSQISAFYNGASATNDDIEVPTSSFLSGHDYIVNWRDALNRDRTYSENIVVNFGHMPIPFATVSTNIIAERLAQTPENWQSLEALYCSVKPARFE